MRAAVPPDPQLRRVRRDVFAGVAIGLALCLSVLCADWMVSWASTSTP
jgi:hypothetical protein